MTAKQSILIGMAISWVPFWTSAGYGQNDKESPRQADPLPTVNLEFNGGSLADYVTALREAIPNFNVVLLVPEAPEILLPAINLNAVAHHPALRLLQGDYRISDGSVIRLLVNDLGGPREGEAASPVFKIWSERQEIKKPPARVRVWNIGGLFLGDRKAEQILTAVETAVGLLPGRGKAEIRYHAETTLILAAGDEEQLLAIDRVVGSLEPGPRAGGNSRASGAGPKPDGSKESRRPSGADPDANVTLHQEAPGKGPETAELLTAFQKELQEKDRIIENLRKRLEAKEKS